MLFIQEIPVINESKGLKQTQDQINQEENIMESNSQNKKGMDRSYHPSTTPKIVFALGLLLIIVFCAWLALFEGWTAIGALFGKTWSLADPTRARILLACVVLYWIRLLITFFYILQRKVSWEEVWGLLIYVGLIEIGLLLVGSGAFRDHPVSLGWLDGIALVLFLLGSFLNTFSEMQRKWWKANPVNKGHCYTGGLFRFSMHINYFGDVVLFTGWCLFTSNLWTLGLSVIMALLFIFVHIPGLDAHLAERYGEEFTTYSKNTKKLIPFIY